MMILYYISYIIYYISMFLNKCTMYNTINVYIINMYYSYVCMHTMWSLVREM